MSAQSPSAYRPAQQPQWLGIVLVLIGAAAYGILVVAAKLNYEHGSDPVTVLFVRAIGFFVLLLIFRRATGRPIALPPTVRYLCLGLGVFLAFQTWCNYAAITFIPVSLAILLLYTYPIFVALATRLIERERLGPIKAGAVLAAFAGLALSLQVHPGVLDPRGLGLGLMAGLGLAITVMVSSRILRRADSARMTLHFTASTSACYLAVLVLTDGWAWPVDQVGWLLLLSMPLVYIVAMLCFFSAVTIIGPLKAATFNNLEPVTTILLAAILLGEALGPWQYVGAALVIGALFAMQIADRRAKARAAAEA
ncbi:MAG: DMT family transporter [Rhodospirillaceae bacterium]|nr:DMT family transporter [Rhodospirillaceae bacterium]MBT6118472.1 DMT family transporter [Rhodospirillaceae bacterium]